MEIAENKIVNQDEINKQEDEEKAWYEFDENGKVKYKEGVLTRHLIKTEKAFYHGGQYYLYEHGVYDSKSREEICSLIKSHCKDEHLKKSHITNVYELWKYDICVKTEELNKDPYILNLKNCLLNLKTMETVEHTENLKSTIQFNVSYNPNLKIKDAKMFNKYLEMCIKDEDTRLLAQEMLGYTYLAVYPEKFFILTGGTNTGKSTFLEIIEYIIGDKNKSAIPLQNLESRFDKVHLFNKLINVCADIPQTAIKDNGTIKMLTGGGDDIYAEHKGIDGFSFKNKAKLIFSCNNLPANESEQSEAFYKRLLILSFPHQIPDKDLDPNFKNKLMSEIDYIFLWGLEGLKRLINNNLQFTEPDISKNLKDKYKKDSNPITLFLEENCKFEKTNTEIYSETKFLYGEYYDWCKSLGYCPKNDSQFGTEIKKIYGNIKIQKRLKKGSQYKRKNVYQGLKYINDNEPKTTSVNTLSIAVNG